MTETVCAVEHGNHIDAEYDAFVARINARFTANVQHGALPVFTTDAAGLWESYLDSFADPAERQYHNCHCCRQFIERFGGLVTIDELGRTTPAVWHEDDAPEAYRAAVTALRKLVSRAKVTGVFLSKDKQWGTPVTGHWHHLAVTPPASMAYTGRVLTAGQAMAEKREDFKTVMFALSEFTQPMLEQALTLLRADTLYRSEKVLGQAQWIYDLHVAKAGGHDKRNVVWRAVATAPAGFCHPRSSMIGTLLEDIAAGLDFSEVSRRFAAKMHPLSYQRPQAAPSAGAIAQAEKLAEQLGIGPSLARRFARLDEITAIWRPVAQEPTAPTGGVFASVKARDAKPVVPNLQTSAQVITFDKFRRTVLPGAKRIEVLVPSRGQFAGITTAVNADAPPILQWDREEQRNPVAWYFYSGGSTASHWGLTSGAWLESPALMLKPSRWFDEEAFAHQGNDAFFVLPGQRTNHVSSVCLFPETLRSELHGIRSVIEAYSRANTLQGYEEASANGLSVLGATIRVTGELGAVTYKIDRWD